MNTYVSYLSRSFYIYYTPNQLSYGYRNDSSTDKIYIYVTIDDSSFCFTLAETTCDIVDKLLEFLELLVPEHILNMIKADINTSLVDLDLDPDLH